MGFILLVIFILIGTWHFLFEDDPDHLFLVSSEGHCLVEATRVGDVKITLEERENVIISFLSIPMCTLTLEGQGILTRATLRSARPDQETSFHLWEYKPDWMAWQMQEETYEENEFFVMEKSLISQSVSWALGVKEEREITTQARHLLSSLVQASPEESVGYRAAVTQSKGEEDFIVVDDFFETGGCGGEVLATSDVVITSLEEAIEGGVERVVIKWFLKDGCLAGEKIHAKK
ncbi:TPA: hypothetical protein DEP34_02240 [Candidatus Uhrbacteria bacterium]|nr:MAG: hypothetical protein UX45_C0032G0013 [Candidatus Uhrbacteria bacterium GW2011_GWF2_46_218]HCB19182.1 hypothetical protein [Candidatus Uhrbacteria bacterium]